MRQRKLTRSISAVKDSRIQPIYIYTSSRVHKEIEKLDEIPQSKPRSRNISIEVNDYDADKREKYEKEQELIKANSLKKTFSIKNALGIEKNPSMDSAQEEKKVSQKSEETKIDAHADYQRNKEEISKEVNILESEKPKNDYKKEAESLLKQQSMKDFINPPKSHTDIDHSKVDQAVKKSATLSGKNLQEKLVKNS